MMDLLARAVQGEVDALQGITALIAIIAIVPSAILFIINQVHQNGQLRSERHRYATEQYHMFLDQCLRFPKLRLGPYAPVPNHLLSEEELYQRDTLFDLLSSIFEGAFLSYANRIRSYRRRQWDGWNAYIDLYVERADYREWWQRVVFDGDRRYLTEEAFRDRNVSQYDRAFERYIFDKLRRHEWQDEGPEVGAPRPPVARGAKRRPRGR